MGKSEQRQLVSELSTKYYESHWVMNMDYSKLIPPISGQTCTADGCDIKAHNYMCWGKSAIEIAPTCLWHSGSDVDPIVGTRWASQNILFARPYLHTQIVPEVTHEDN